MNKKGQFYLIAAIIIISVLIGISVYKNSAQSTKNAVVYDLGKELKVETGNVYDYGAYNKEDTNALITDWTTRYYEYAKTQGSTESWLFVYGSRAGMTAILFSTTEAGSVSIDTGNALTSVTIIKNIRTPIAPELTTSGEVNIKFNDVVYPFRLEEGQNFFFIIKGGTATSTPLNQERGLDEPQ